MPPQPKTEEKIKMEPRVRMREQMVRDTISHHIISSSYLSLIIVFKIKMEPRMRMREEMVRERRLKRERREQVLDIYCSKVTIVCS